LWNLFVAFYIYTLFLNFPTAAACFTDLGGRSTPVAMIDLSYRFLLADNSFPCVLSDVASKNTTSPHLVSRSVENQQRGSYKRFKKLRRKSIEGVQVKLIFGLHAAFIFLTFMETEHGCCRQGSENLGK
jgi:hypothetical protein